MFGTDFMPWITKTWADISSYLHLEKFNGGQWIVAYLVLIIPAMVSWFYKMELEKDLIKTSLRAAFQLLLITILLVPVFMSGIAIQISLIAVMIVMGAFIDLERGKDIKNAFWIALVAIVVSYGFTIGVFLLTGVLKKVPNVVIPISGMLIGNAVRTVSLFYHRAAKDFEQHREMVEAMLLDGVSVNEALKIPSRETLRNSMVPRIDSLKTLGIVHIPGAMAGMMVAGAYPIEAAGYQILIFLGIVGISTLASLIANNLTYKSLFKKFYPHLS